MDCRKLIGIVLSTMIITTLLRGTSPAYAQTSLAAGVKAQVSTGITWRFDFQSDVPNNQVQAMGGVERTGDNLRTALSDKLSGMNVSIEVQPPQIQGTKIAYPVALKGQSSQDELRQVLFSDLGKDFDFLGGTVLVDISGTANAREDLAVSLESRLSTGYQWQVVGDSANLLQTSRASEQVSRSNFPGASGSETLHLRATGAGVTTLQLAYQRGFGPEEPSTRHLQITMDVFDNTVNLTNPQPNTQATPPDLPQSSGKAAQAMGSVSAASLPASLDWRAQGKVPPIRNQGSCGGCWAFGTVGVMESALMIFKNVTADLSEEYLIRCNTSGWNCANGGWWAHDYHINTGGKNNNLPGAVLESDFPYNATDGTCPAVYNHPYSLSSWAYVTNSYSVPSVDQIKQAISTYGPVGVAVCVDTNFDNYRNGVFSTNSCTSGVNHAVVLVGWNDTDQAWIMRNSWGTGWGEQGYMRIKWGTDQIGYAANYVITSSSAPVCYSLTTTINPGSGGSVQSSPAPNCNNGTQYTAGAKVQLTAAPNGSYVFSGWSGSLTGMTNPATLTMNADRSVTAGFVSAPANDAMTQAIDVPNPGGGVTDYRNSQNTLAATTANNDPLFPLKVPSTGYHSVWYHFVPFANGTLALDTYTSKFNTLLAIYTKDSGGNLKRLGWNDDVANQGGASGLVTAVTSGVEYFIEAAGKTTAAGVLNFHLKHTPARWTNNSISYPVILTDTGTAVSFARKQDVYGATTSTSDPAFSGIGQGIRSVWYKFTPRANGALTVDTLGSSYDTILGVWTGATSALTPVAWDDNGGGGGISHLQTNLIGRVTYFIEVASKSGETHSNLSFQVAYAPVTLVGGGVAQDTLPAIYYQGSWSVSGDRHVTSLKNDTAGLSFNGSKVRLGYFKTVGGGQLSVYIDGKYLGLISQSGTVETAAVWTSTLFAAGPHQLVVKNYAGKPVDIDWIEVVP